MACRRYLLHFANEHIDFHQAELKTLCHMFNVECRLQSHSEEHYDKRNPFVTADFTTEECLRKIMSRTILIKSAFELWSEGCTLDETLKNLKLSPPPNMPHYLSADTSFRVMINGFNKTYNKQQMLEKIEYIVEHVDFQGNVKLKSPDISVHLLEYYGQDADHQAKGTPDYMFLGKWVADGQRDNIQKYDLKKRHFIGNTSMDNKLSMLMANMACVKRNGLVLDPFVGTGSLLVSAAHFGGYVIGTDLDWNIIHGQGRSSRKGVGLRGDDENIRANLRFYGLESHYLEAFVADASRHNIWRQGCLFDAIITDPPYGIREGTKKVGPRKQETPVEKPDHAFPTKRAYQLSDVFTDLLNFSAKYLVMNGRLVFWLPVYVPDYSEENIPAHPCLTLIANSEQVLVKDKVSRRLITMEKTSPWEDDLHQNGATIEADHYTESFRDRYFKPPERKQREEEIAKQKRDKTS